MGIEGIIQDFPINRVENDQNQIFKKQNEKQDIGSYGDNGTGIYFKLLTIKLIMFREDKKSNKYILFIFIYLIYIFME